MSKRRHNFGTKRFKEKSLYFSCPYRAEVADTAVCTPDCARCQNRENTHTDTQTDTNPRRNLTEMLHVLGEHTGMKLSCIKPTSKVRGLSIEPRSSTGCID